MIGRIILILGLLIVCAVPGMAEVVVKDDGGRSLAVTQPFSRIISLYGAHTENLFDLGLHNEVIGVSPSDKHFAPARGKTVFSYHDGPEKFLAAAPDLVLIRPMIDRAYTRLISRLEKNGITVMSLQPGSVKEMYEYWLKLGHLTGKTTEAQAMVAGFKRSVTEVKKKTDYIQKPKRVYFEAMHRQMRTFTTDSMAIFCLETAGGINVAGDAESSRGTNIGIYGKERILSHAGDIDVFLVQVGRMNQADVDTIRNEPGFDIIKAVRNDQIFLVDETLVSRPTPRLIEGIHQIARVLYPELFHPEKEVPGA